jgi:hypothetical protein
MVLDIGAMLATAMAPGRDCGRCLCCAAAAQCFKAGGKT